MTFHVKDQATWKAMASGFVKDGGIWKPIKELWVNDVNVWKRAYQNVIEIVQTGHEAHVYLRSKVIAAGWNGSDPVKVVYTITGGVWVYSAPGNWALNLRDFPAGSEITVINNGYIAGQGGTGGAGGGYNTAGFGGGQGGHALLLSEAGNYTQIIYNNAYIWGGGGGGGGGGGAYVLYRRMYPYFQGPSTMLNEWWGYVGGGGGGGGYGALGTPSGGGGINYNRLIQINDRNGSSRQVTGLQPRDAAGGSGASGGAGAHIRATTDDSNGSAPTTIEATAGPGGSGGDYGGYGSAGGGSSTYSATFNRGDGDYTENELHNYGGGPGGPPGYALYNHAKVGVSAPNGWGDIRGLTQA